MAGSSGYFFYKSIAGRLALWHTVTPRGIDLALLPGRLGPTSSSESNHEEKFPSPVSDLFNVIGP
jgi:hypothetical protein